MALWIGAALSALPRLIVNNEVTCRIGSLMASVAILMSLNYPSAKNSLLLFTGHIIADTVFGVKSRAHYVHHLATFVMAIITLWWMATRPFSAILYFNTQLILCMEMTTPFLHLAWLFKHFGEKGFALVFGVITCTLWIVRIYIPLQIMVNIYGFDMDPVTKGALTFCVGSLFFLQVYWGVKLLSIVCAFRATIRSIK